MPPFFNNETQETHTERKREFAPFLWLYNHAQIKKKKKVDRYDIGICIFIVFLSISNHAVCNSIVVYNLFSFLYLFTGQALCGTCRDETHRAKMFSKHDIIHMSMKTKENAKKVNRISILYLDKYQNILFDKGKSIRNHVCVIYFKK